MPARHTIVTMRDHQTLNLSAEVSSLLPVAAEEGRVASRRTRTATVRTTFCPVCGGNKRPASRRCQSCHWETMRQAAAAARARGRRSLGRLAASRANVRATGAPTIHPSAVTTDRRVRGPGVSRRQPWRRHVLVDGQWVEQEEE